MNTAGEEIANKEGVGEIKDYYTIKDEDKDLVAMINSQLESAGKTHEEFKKDGKLNEQYWSRDHFKTISLRWHNSRIIQNVIYVGVETMIPIITSQPAEPVITIADDENEDEEKSKKFVDKLQKVLLAKYYDQDYPQQELMEMLARHLLLYKIAEPKIIWDERLNDYIVEYIHPHKMIVSPDGHYNQDVWAAQYLERPLKTILSMFPDKEQEIVTSIFPGKTLEDVKQFGNTPIGFWEYHPEDGKYVVWKMRDVVLQKKLNPYLVWTDDQEFDKAANHFDYPHKPLMFLNSQNLGRHIWDDTTPVTQVIPIQDGINLMQRIITDTSRDQGILVGAQELIDRDELYKYTGAPTDKLIVKGGDPSRALHRLEPKQLAAFVQDNLNHLINMADNIMGTHATTRGERSGNATLGQDQLAKESDYGRIDLIVRGIERLFAEIYNWEIQMMLAKYEPEHYARILGKKKGQELYDEMKEYNKRGIKIVVKPGSTLPTDKISQRAEALDLAKLNRISNLDLFERMDFANPMEMAKNVYLEANAPEELYPDLAGIMQQKAAAQAAPPLPEGGAPLPLPPEAGTLPPMPGAEMPALPPEQVPLTSQVPSAPMFTEDAGGPQLSQITGATEHTEALLAGEAVPPFTGIDPANYEVHVTAELEFLAGDDFLTLPPEIQTLYARHALQERQLLEEQGQTQPLEVPGV